jgi:hypothetical protein
MRNLKQLELDMYDYYNKRLKETRKELITKVCDYLVVLADDYDQDIEQLVMDNPPELIVERVIPFNEEKNVNKLKEQVRKLEATNYRLMLENNKLYKDNAILSSKVSVIEDLVKGDDRLKASINDLAFKEWRKQKVTNETNYSDS